MGRRAARARNSHRLPPAAPLAHVPTICNPRHSPPSHRPTPLAHSQHERLLGGEGLDVWAREATLHMCAAQPGEYECVLTSGATAGLRLLAEAFPWARGGRLWYTQVWPRGDA